MSVRILVGDVRERLAEIPDGSIQCCVTSPPYMGLRNYGVDGQIGLEPTLAEYIAALVDVFRQVKRVLRDDGTLWLNLGDSYAGMYVGRNDAGRDIGGRGGNKNGSGNPGNGRSAGLMPGFKPKDLMMVPARVAIALQDDGWWLRSNIVWSKPNPMPESVQDRPTSAHESIFLLTKQARYFYDADAVRRPLAESSLDRLSQDVENQAGSDRANGGAKTNGPMKAVVRSDKQRGHARRHAGFNDRWDNLSREEQQAGGANLRNVWHIATRPFSEAHFATFPPEIPRLCIKAGSRPGDTVLDPFGGAGTTGLVADELGRDCVLIELNPEYAAIAERRIFGAAPLFASVEVA